MKTMTDLLVDLHRVYRSRGDSYHGLQHIEECFAELNKLIDAGLIENEEAMRLAIWYHDYYQLHNGDDEELSAKEAYNAALSIGYDEAFAKIVYRPVLVTKHGTHLPQNNDEMFMADIDLVPFAADNFTERTMWVRQEYPDVPDDAFFPARRDVLRGFLVLPYVYHTPYYRERLEVAAKRNLAAAVAVKNMTTSEESSISEK
jgi:predicted metal-dependent HD superfamily phosphohydrolase